MTAIQDYLEKGVTQFSVKDGEAIAVNPYENSVTFFGIDAIVYSDWKKFEALNLPPIPCPAIADGVYEIGDLAEALQWLYPDYSDEWQDDDKDGSTVNPELFPGYKERTVLVLKDQPEELLPEGFKEYKCTDCQTVNVKKDNGEITVGLCDNCEHPLWNEDQPEEKPEGETIERTPAEQYQEDVKNAIIAKHHKGLLIDFADWLWDTDRLEVRTQIEPFETTEMIADFYLKANTIESESKPVEPEGHPVERSAEEKTDDLMECNTCGLSFDMSDLSQVFAHEHDNPTIINAHYKSKRVTEHIPEKSAEDVLQSILMSITGTSLTIREGDTITVKTALSAMQEHAQNRLKQYQAGLIAKLEAIKEICDQDELIGITSAIELIKNS